MLEDLCSFACSLLRCSFPLLRYPFRRSRRTAGHFNRMQKGVRAGRIGFDATTTINRLDYGLKWNRAAEGGGVMLGDDVKIEINVEAVRARP